MSQYIFLLLSIFILAIRQSRAQCQNPSRFRFRPTFANNHSGHVIFNGLQSPRGIRFDTSNPPNLLVIERGVGVTALIPHNTSGGAWEKKEVVQNPDLNHGLEVGDGFLFASTSDAAYRWSYDASTASVTGNQQTLVTGMDNTDHNTRTLLYQPSSENLPPQLIISRGSESNLDIGSGEVTTGRGQIRRFMLNDSIPSSGYSWFDGELLSWGMRNGVGLSLSQDASLLWEVENSADDLTYLGQDVHEDNPAEELNLIQLNNASSLGAYYGYPDCFTIWNITTTNSSSNLVTGDQFSIGTTGKDDAFCADQSRNRRPVLAFQAHSAPLDIKFYSAPTVNKSYAVDTSWNGHAFVSMHGSWDRTRPTGYGVVRIPWANNTPQAKPNSGNGYSFVVQAPDLSKCSGECIRPVGIAFDGLGRMFVSSDATGEIFIVENQNAPDATSSAHRIADTGLCRMWMALLMLFVNLILL